MVKVDIGEYEGAAGQGEWEHSTLVFLRIDFVERHFKWTAKQE